MEKNDFESYLNSTGPAALINKDSTHNTAEPAISLHSKQASGSALAR